MSLTIAALLFPARIAYCMISHGTFDSLLFDKPDLEWEQGVPYFDAGHYCTHGDVVFPVNDKSTQLHVMVDLVKGMFFKRSIGLANILAPYADVPFKMAGISTIFGATAALALFVLLKSFKDHASEDALWFFIFNCGICAILIIMDWGYWRKDRTASWYQRQRASREELESLRTERRATRYNRTLEQAKKRKSKRRKKGGRRAGQEAALDALDPVQMEYGTSVLTTLPVKRSGHRRRGTQDVGGSGYSSFSESEGESSGSESEGDGESKV